MEVPVDVVIVTWAAGPPGGAGTVSVQVPWVGQLVGAACPLNAPTIWPLELRKLFPTTTICCPGDPLAGASEVMTGTPLAGLGTGAGVVVGA